LEAGSGKPLVLIHGWSQCAEEFKHLIAELSGSHRVIAIGRDLTNEDFLDEMAEEIT